MNRQPVHGFLFDVYGTVFDWFTPLSLVFEAANEQFEQTANPGELARQWRNGYAQETSRRGLGAEPWKPLVEITAELLDEVLGQHYGYNADYPEMAILADQVRQWNLAWRQLVPWPDTRSGLSALRELAPIATCSNGNLVDMASVAARLDVRWNAILGAPAAGYYKPHPDVYLKSAAALEVQPENAVMVACHQGDLKAARALGLQTAFVRRPMEFGGPGLGEEIDPVDDWEFVANSFDELATLVEAHAQAS